MTENSYLDIKISNADKTTKASLADASKIAEIESMYVDEKGYIRFRSSESGKSILLHRHVMGVLDKKWFEVDHINRDRLDNRRSNLRLVSNVENNRNRGALPSRAIHGFVSEYKGVNFDYTGYKEGKKSLWRSRIGLNGKRISLGRYETQEEAAIAYNIAAKKLFGEHAYLNKVNTEILPIEIKNRIGEIKLGAFRQKTSKYRGVSKMKWYENKWEAYIQHKGKKINLGTYTLERDAAKAYNEAAKEYHNDKAILNILDTQEFAISRIQKSRG